MKHAESVTFGGSGLDRAAHLRADPPKGDVLPLWRGKVLLGESGEARSPLFLPSNHEVFEDAIEPAIFLGLDEGVPRFVRDISSWEPEDDLGTVGAFHDPSEQRHPGIDAPHVFAELRANMLRLTPREAELVATGKALIEWHARTGSVPNAAHRANPRWPVGKGIAGPAVGIIFRAPIPWSSC